jgi:hypothetical protein
MDDLEKLQQDIKDEIIKLLKNQTGKIPYDEKKPFFPLRITIEIEDLI